MKNREEKGYRNLMCQCAFSNLTSYLSGAVLYDACVQEKNQAVEEHAEEDTRAFLGDAAAAGVQGVLHCFTGSRDLAAAGLDAGWHVSFSGIVTFRSWTDLDILRDIPDDRLLVESDAPYLAPVPNRSKRNEPAFVSLTVARIAAVRGTTPDRLGDITLANTVRLFALPSSVFDIN